MSAQSRKLAPRIPKLINSSVLRSSMAALFILTVKDVYLARSQSRVVRGHCWCSCLQSRAAATTFVPYSTSVLEFNSKVAYCNVLFPSFPNCGRRISCNHNMCLQAPVVHACKICGAFDEPLMQAMLWMEKRMHNCYVPPMCLGNVYQQMLSAMKSSARKLSRTLCLGETWQRWTGISYVIWSVVAVRGWSFHLCWLMSHQWWLYPWVGLRGCTTK